LVVVVGPLMGLCLPWRSVLAEPAGSMRCRVLTCNVHSDRFNPVALRSVIDETKPDIVALQDWSPAFAVHVFGDGWNLHHVSQFSLASRYPIKDIRLRSEPGPARNAVLHACLETSVGDLHFFNVHLASPRDGLVAVRVKLWKGSDVLQANSVRRREQSQQI